MFDFAASADVRSMLLRSCTRTIAVVAGIFVLDVGPMLTPAAVASRAARVSYVRKGCPSATEERDRS